jgi:hypothetical protein
MGGQTFYETKTLDNDLYNQYIERIYQLKQLDQSDQLNFLMPYRLKNKLSHNDIDIIISDTDAFIEKYKLIDEVREIKTIPLFEERFNLYSKHILTKDLVQIDLLKSWNSESVEITKAYYSYSFANIFLKRLATIVDRNLKFSYLGLFCSNNKFVIPPNIKYIQIDENTRLIIDPFFAFELLDLNYLKYINGFDNEAQLLEYFSKSKYYGQIKFKNNSKFKHDYNRLKPFKSLVDKGLIVVENL